ncbi:MAG: hypothetical protein J4G11_12135, partial [Acidimicrobiia bacterium]|nr:hypothetical protein [Acidimicrobiia bacterium]
VIVPRMENRDEWGKALVTLSIGVLEGFSRKELRKVLKAEGIEVCSEWGSIVLLEKVLRARGVMDTDSKLVALRELNDGRRFSGVHVRGSDAKAYLRATLNAHGSHQKHFEHLCTELAKELTLIEDHLVQTENSASNN